MLTDIAEIDVWARQGYVLSVYIDNIICKFSVIPATRQDVSNNFLLSPIFKGRFMVEQRSAKALQSY